ncbi:MAG: hypothetical protein ABI720_12345 [Actinomycetes bacterium]
MSTKAPRLIIATVAVTLISLSGFAAPADAAKPAQQRTVWCC